MNRITSESLIDVGLSANESEEISQKIDGIATSNPEEIWRTIAQSILRPDHPFQVHRFFFETIFRDWTEENGPPPAWSPQTDEIENTNAAAVMHQLRIGSYAEFHAWSVENREAFWQIVVERLGIQLRREYSLMMDLSAGIEKPFWLVGAELNIVESCFSASLDSPAIVYQRENGPLKNVTVGELQALTNRVANGLVQQGFRPNDAIAIVMPMTSDAVAIYLGIIKAGCVAISIADSFTANEIATRLRLGRAKAIFTGDVIQRDGKQLPLYQKIVDAEAPTAIVLRSSLAENVSLREGDLWWEDFLSDRIEFEAVVRQPNDIINILFSSGTTGAPKVIPWTQTTPLKCAADAHFHHDIHPTEVVAWPTNLGWMMGPWLVFAALLNRATIAIYEGAPTGKAFGLFVQEAKVNMLGIVPSLAQLWRRSECMRGLDWSAIKLFSSTGEVSNATDMLYCMSIAGYRPVIEYCGGTEIGGGYLTGTLLRPCAPGTFNTLALAMDAIIMDEAGEPSDHGEIFLIPPSIGLSTLLLNNDHHEVYFENTPPGVNGEVLRRHGDQIERLPNGYYRAQGRADDTMNLGGIKVSSAEVERVLNTLPNIVETSAIAIASEGGGPSLLIIYAVCSEQHDIDRTDLLASMQALIKARLNPLFRVHDVVVVDKLPRTASNKILRRELREQYSA